MTVSVKDQIASVRREIGMRKRVYPRWVESKKMTQAEADKEMAAMEAVHASLMAIATSARPNMDGTQRLELRRTVSFELAEIIIGNIPAQGALL